MSWFITGPILAVGLVLIVEGLVYALAPWLIEDLLEALKDFSLDARRMIGFMALCAGAVLVLLAVGLAG